MKQRSFAFQVQHLYETRVLFPQRADATFWEASGHVTSRQEVVNAIVWQWDRFVIDVWYVST